MRTAKTIIIDAYRIVEAVFVFFLLAVLVSNLILKDVGAAPGISNRLSYQGRLTDSAGNPLGGAGAVYCFRYSIYDDPLTGSKVWPAGTPTNSTTTVVDGVFNAYIGEADQLDLDFTATNSLYLQVEANTATSTCSGSWEALLPRQNISATGYARAAENIYSSLLRTQAGSGVVQIGTGAGAATPIFLGLDVKNTDESVDSFCSGNGRLWYNSFDGKGRICQNGVIRDMVDGLLIRDEGADVDRASAALNFTGNGVSVTSVSGVVDVAIPGGSLEYLGGATLVSDAATIDVTLSAAKEHLNCYLESKGGSASGISQARFNGDSGAASYGWNETYIVAAAIADIQDSSDDAIQLTGTTADTDPTSSVLRITNFSDKNKTVIYDTVTVEPVATNSDRHQGVGGWYNTTSQITSVTFSRSAGNYLVGSHVWCEGRDI